MFAGASDRMIIEMSVAAEMGRAAAWCSPADVTDGRILVFEMPATIGSENT
jgi:hypothetical protein